MPRTQIKAVKKMLRSFALSQGWWLEQTVSNEELLGLISRLSPAQAKPEMRRIGPAKDGGYLLPDDLGGIGALISPGVAQECGFDFEIAEMGIPVYLLDGSISKPPREHDNFHFFPLFLDAFTSEHTVTITDVCDDVTPGLDLLLQMDIEGAEYRVLKTATEQLLSRFRIMVIEFHFLDYLFTKYAFKELDPLFSKLLRTHRVVHIHPNNIERGTTRGVVSIPSTMEFTFYRNDRGPFSEGACSYPHPLDADNHPHMPSLILPKCWMGGTPLSSRSVTTRLTNRSLVRGIHEKTHADDT